MSRRRCTLALALLALLFPGCATNEDTEQTKQSSIPWGRPADWEGTVPGLGR